MSRHHGDVYIHQATDTTCNAVEMRDTGVFYIRTCDNSFTKIAAHLISSWFIRYGNYELHNPLFGAPMFITFTQNLFPDGERVWRYIDGDDVCFVWDSKDEIFEIISLEEADRRFGKCVFCQMEKGSTHE